MRHRLKAKDETALLARAGRGDQEALGTLLERYREPLRRMVRLRLDHRLQGRLDASDVVQEAWLEAARRSEEYLKDPALPFLLWLRLITADKILAVERRHLGAQARDARREVDCGHRGIPQASGTAAATELVGTGTSPTQAAARQELRALLEAALERMDPVDREVLLLRHFEQLGNAEAAQELGIQPEAARKRYFRAARRLRELLRGLPALEGEASP